MVIHWIFGKQRRNMTNRASRKAQITALRRKQILDAASEVFLKKGYSGATVPEIARQAGLATGTIYLYYPGKRALFAAIIDKIYVTPSIDVSGNESSQDFSTGISEKLNNRFSLPENGMISRVSPLLGDIFSDVDLRTLVVKQSIEPFLIQMEKFCRSRITSSEFRNCEPVIVARAIASIIEGMGILKIFEGDACPLNRFSKEKVANELMDLILYGLLNPEQKADIKRKQSRKVNTT
jgi:AcrR family transcriptional regulator